MSSWVILVIAGLMEIAWAVGLKSSQGFTRLWPSLITVVAFIGSVGLLSLAVKSLPLGTAYAVWVGIGALGAAIFGIVVFQEPVTGARLFFLGLLLVAIIGLKATTH